MCVFEGLLGTVESFQRLAFDALAAQTRYKGWAFDELVAQTRSK